MSYSRRSVSAALAALALGLGGCGQGDTGNVMGAGANSLTPAQVDAALGPEVANEAGNALNVPGDANAVAAGDRPAAAEPAARRPAAPARSGPAEESGEDEPATSAQDNESEL